MMKFKIAALTAGLLIAVTTAGSHAAMTLKFDDLSNGVGIDLMVVDNGVGDTNAAMGQIDLFGGTAGTFNVTAIGVSDKVSSQLTLSSLVVGGGVGMLEVMLSDTGFTAPAFSPLLTSEVNVTLTEGGSALMQQFVDDTDTLFGMQQGIDHGTFNNNNTNATQSFDDSASQFVNIVGNHSITEYVKITHTDDSVSNTSFGIISTVTPEPASLALVAVGGLLIASRRKK